MKKQKKSKKSKEWNKRDFVKSVYFLMKKQEAENPAIKQVHARLSPEWKEAEKLVGMILTAENEGLLGGHIDKLVGMGEIATRVLIDFFIRLKSV